MTTTAPDSLHESGNLDTTKLLEILSERVRGGEAVFNVLQYGVKGDDATDDAPAIQALSELITTLGGGTMWFPPRTYRTSTAIRCTSNVRYVGHGATMRNTKTTGHPFPRAVFIPGYIHGVAFNNANSSHFPRISILDVAQGATTVTASAAGGLDSVTPGMFVAVRSTGHYKQGSIEIPSRTYFTKIIAKDGDTLTLSDEIPETINGALVHPLTDGVTDDSGLPMWVAENVAIEGFTIDSHSIVQGGGAYRFYMADITTTRRMVSTFITLNAMTHAEFERCHLDFSYTFCELALGSRDVRVHDNTGTYRRGNGDGFHPVSIVEGANNIRFERNTVTVPADFNQPTTTFFNIAQCGDVRIRDNVIAALGGMEAVFAIAGGAVPERISKLVSVTDNTIRVAPGMNRVFSIGSGSSSPPRGLSIKDNMMSGALKPAVNQWMSMGAGVDYQIAGNTYPSGSTHRLPAAGTGRFDGNTPATI